LNDTEIWRLHNLTEDAHPIHLHLVMFQVLGRAPLDDPENIEPPEDWETGWKDTVIAYPDEVTYLIARFDLPGLYVWHCHILEHEDNEMMRPYYVGDMS
jgi:spore coat protein A